MLESLPRACSISFQTSILITYYVIYINIWILFNDFVVVVGAILVAENEQEIRGRSSGASFSASYVMWDICRTAALRPVGGRWFSSVCRPQAGRPVGLGRVIRPGAAIRPIIRSLCLAPFARQAAWICHRGRGTGTRRDRVRAVGRDPRGFVARGRSYSQKAFARRGRRSVNHLYMFYIMFMDLNF